MKGFFKSALLAVLALGLIALALPASAQIGEPKVVWSSAKYTAAVGQNAAIVGSFCGTNNLSINTNIVTVPYGMRQMGVGFSTQLLTSGSTTNSVIIEKSIDGVVWQPLDANIAVTHNGTTFVGFSTNYDVVAYSKIRFTVTTSAAGTSPMTNAALTLNWNR